MVRARRCGLAVSLVAMIVVVLSACGKPTLGAKCTAGKGACLDAKSGLFCGADGTYKAMTCGGEHGCTAQGGNVLCDNDIAAVGDGCDTPNDGACTADKHSLLQCKAEKFTLIDTCKGPGACKIKGDIIACDNDVADVNDPCSNKGNFACTSDRATALRCDDGKYETIQSCRGPRACTIVHDKQNPKLIDIDCDYSVASENEPCLYAGNESCSSDRKTMLTCRGRKYTDPVACPGPAGCTVRVTGKTAKAVCDTGVAPEPERRVRRRHR